MGPIGFPSLILILIVAFIVFGPAKLPEIGKAAGKTLKEFKEAMNGSSTADEEEVKRSNENQQK